MQPELFGSIRLLVHSSLAHNAPGLLWVVWAALDFSVGVQGFSRQKRALWVADFIVWGPKGSGPRFGIKSATFWFRGVGVWD